MGSEYDWDAYHREEAYRARYPDENVIRFLAANYPRDRHDELRILDLGCGAGRHVVLLAKEGFNAHGVDGSQGAVDLTKAWLDRERLKADVRQSPMTSLPFKDGFFHGVIEVSVLIHNPPREIRKIVSEVHRVLRPEGRGFFLLLSRRDFLYGRGEEIEPSTFLIDETDWVSKQAGTEVKPKLLYHLFDKEEIKQIFKDFKKIRIESLEHSFHSLSVDAEARHKAYWVVVVEKG